MDAEVMLIATPHPSPRIPQRHRAVEYEPLWRRVPVEAEVTVAQELELGAHRHIAHLRLDEAIMKHFQRLWIKVRDYITALGGIFCPEERVI